MSSQEVACSLLSSAFGFFGLFHCHSSFRVALIRREYGMHVRQSFACPQHINGKIHDCATRMPA
jgi:hypothetical protein